MSFATKILFKIFKIDELHGHNVSGKTLNKNIKTKLPLDPIRIGYIKYLVESYYDEKECRAMLSGAITHKQDLWKSCHTALNKSILISERKAAVNLTNNNTTTMTSLNDGIGLNATNLTTSENTNLSSSSSSSSTQQQQQNSTNNSNSNNGPSYAKTALTSNLSISNRSSGTNGSCGGRSATNNGRPRKPGSNYVFKEENIQSYTDANGVVYKVSGYY